MVGCVLVKNGRTVGEGWHRSFGGPHAETVALDDAGSSARGATAYVSLEPCRHDGKTPACTRALQAAGVARVVFGAADPGSASGGGGAELAAAGIEVVGPVMTPRQARRENPAFFHVQTRTTPYVAAKLALSLDGYIAAAPGERTALTGEAAAVETHRLRAGFDAIVVGSTTARVDDPLLTVRHGQSCRRPPVRIVLDADADLSHEAALFDDVGSVPVWVVCAEDAAESAMERLEGAGARVHPVARGADGVGVDPHAVAALCREAGLTALLLEGGGRVVASFAAAELLHRLHLLVAPRLLGAGGVPAFPGWADGGPAVGWHPAAPPRVLGDDTMLIYDREA
jgi:diaminohydroxyphosphoribosylaminopyrimidine deaminase/5-amino-6-(5-phosphoribosylamino)uracil reductase